MPGPAPVPRPPPVPGPCPGPPVAPSPVPTATGGVMASVGGGTSSLTGSVGRAETVGTVTAGAGGTFSARGVESDGSANQLTAGRPPPPPPPRGPLPPPPPFANRAAPRHSTRITIVTCTMRERAAAGPSRRRGRGSAYLSKTGRVVGEDVTINRYTRKKNGARFHTLPRIRTLERDN